MKNEETQRESVFLRLSRRHKEELTTEAEERKITLTDYLLRTLQARHQIQSFASLPQAEAIFLLARKAIPPLVGAVELYSTGYSPKWTSSRVLLLCRPENGPNTKRLITRTLQKWKSDSAESPERVLNFIVSYLPPFSTEDPFWFEVATSGKILWDPCGEIHLLLGAVREKISCGNYRRKKTGDAVLWSSVPAATPVFDGHTTGTHPIHGA